MGSKILTNKNEPIQIKIWQSHPVARAKHSLMTDNKTTDKAQLDSYCLVHNVILFLNFTMKRKWLVGECRIVNSPLTLMFRFTKMSPKHGSANAIQLTSFNHINGNSSTTSLENPSNGVEVQQIRSAIQGSSKTEILGPSGTVRGYKNIIRERKEVLRLSVVGETLEVGLRNSYESKQFRLLLIIYANNLIYRCDKKYQACDISDVVVVCLNIYRKAKRARLLCTRLQWEEYDQKWKSVHTSENCLTIWDLKLTNEIYLCTKTIKANLTCGWQSKTPPFLMYS